MVLLFYRMEYKTKHMADPEKPDPNVPDDSPEWYRTIIENTSDILYSFRPRTGTVTFVTPNVSQFGYKPTEIVGHAITDFIHPEDLESVMADVERTVTTGETFPTPFRLKKKDGTFVYVEETGNPVYKGNELDYIIGVIRDISAQKRAEEALAESEGKYRGLFEHSLDAIMIFDAETGQFENANPATLGMFGYTLKEFCQLTIRDITAEPEKTRETVGRLRDGEIEALHIPLRLMKRKDGSAFPAEIMASIITIENRKKLLGSLRDISERKREENERRKLEERLAQSEKMEALGRLAAGVVHDLSNLLSPIVGYPDLLLSQLPLDSPGRNALNAMKESGEKAAAVVEDLLTITRRRVIQKSVVNLNAIIETYLESPEFDDMIAWHQDVEITTDLAPDLKNLFGAPLHLSKTVMNLIQNAAEAMPRGGSITISTGNTELQEPVAGYDEVKPGEYICMVITDNGKGIPAHDIKSIFEPFYTRKLMGRSGTGLGLTIVWGTLEDHHGYITVSSMRDEGTTFTLYFPSSDEPIGTGHNRIPIEHYQGNERIVAVDDKEEQLEIITMMLQRLGYQVTGFATGEEAVEYMTDNTTDLILLDVVMDPGMDGFETFKAIRNIHPDQKAMFVTGYTEPELILEAKRLGVDQYVKKPYTLEKIGMAIREALASRS